MFLRTLCFRCGAAVDGAALFAGVCPKCGGFPLRTFEPKRGEPEFQPLVAPPEFVRALADRILACHEILAHKAEKRQPVLTEVDACPLG